MHIIIPEWGQTPSFIIHSMSLKPRQWLRSGLVFLFVLAAFSYFNGDNGLRDHNVESRMALVKAIVDEQRFQIDSYHNSLFATRDKAFYEGHYYSDKAIGDSLLGAIAYKSILWIGAKTRWVLRFKYFRDVITILTVSILSAFIAPLLYSLVRRVSPETTTGQAVFVALALTLGTAYFKYSTRFYGHSVAGLLLFAAFYIWFSYRHTDMISAPGIFLSGFLLGWSIITEYPTAPLAIAVGLYMFFVQWEKRRLYAWSTYALIGLGALIPIGILLFYNYACFGSWFSMGYAHEAVGKYSAASETGLFGLGLPNPTAHFLMTFHPSMGIFWQSPDLLLALPGWFHLLRSEKYRAEGWFSLLIILFYVVLFSGYYMWWGGTAFTPRHIIPILPFFVLPLSVLPKKYAPFLVVAGVLSIAQMLIVAAGNPNGLPELVAATFEKHITPPTGSIIYNIYLRNIMQGFFAHNLGESIFKLNGFLAFLPLLLFEAVIIGLMVVVSAGPDRVLNPHEPPGPATGQI